MVSLSETRVGALDLLDYYTVGLMIRYLFVLQIEPQRSVAGKSGLSLLGKSVGSPFSVEAIEV